MAWNPLRREETATEVMLMAEAQRAERQQRELSGVDPFAMMSRAMMEDMLSRENPGEMVKENIEKPETAEADVVVDDEYLALSESIGVDSPIVADELLKRCLKQQRIFVYPTAHVEKYLRSIFDNNRQRLVWRGLRGKDAKGLGQGVYNHAIPGHALLKAEKVIKTFDRPDDLCFEVSDYEAVKPDPFLSVRIQGSQTRFVIAYWDEPNFRMEE